MHQDEDARKLRILSDDERPLVFYDDRQQTGGESGGSE